MEPIRCEMYTQEHGGLVRCEADANDIIDFEDGSQINLCKEHYNLVLKNMTPKSSP